MRKLFSRMVGFTAICLLVLALNFTLITAPAAAVELGVCMGTGTDASACNRTISQVYPCQPLYPPCSGESSAQGDQSAQPGGSDSNAPNAFPGWYGSGWFGPGWYGAQGGQSPPSGDSDSNAPKTFPGWYGSGWYGAQGGQSPQRGNPGSNAPSPSPDESDEEGGQSAQPGGPGSNAPNAFPGWFGFAPNAFPRRFGFAPYAFPGWYGAQGGQSAQPGSFGSGAPYAFPGWSSSECDRKSPNGESSSNAPSPSSVKTDAENA